MTTTLYAEISHQLLFTVFDSTKPKKNNLFRVHHHAELELGYIVSGEGDYHLENERYNAQSGDLFLVRPNEQHCIPTITTAELVSFNLHITPYFLWNVCADFIDNRYLRALVNVKLPVCHHFRGMDGFIESIQSLAEEPEKNRFLIRHSVLKLLEELVCEIPLPENTSEKYRISNRLNDIQNAICFIHDHLSSQMTIEEIAYAANMSRSHLEAHFKLVTGIAPYEYLIIRRTEQATTLLRETEAPISEIAQECGFSNLANFNKTFKRITCMTPREYRLSQRLNQNAADMLM